MAFVDARDMAGWLVDMAAQGQSGGVNTTGPAGMTTFRGLLHAATSVGDHEAVVPSIQGRAWITGYTQHVLQPDDPFATGLPVGDIWSSVRD